MNKTKDNQSIRSLTRNSQELRKNMTKEEKHLWYDFLKKLPITVNRQRKIGQYIVDFYIASAKIVIELDGSQHYTPENKEADSKRDSVLSEYGITVLRYSNLTFNKNFDGVCADILKHLNERGVYPDLGCLKN